MRYYEQEPEMIDLFREEYEFLSNFYPAKMRFEGISYHNAEAAYQAQKCADPKAREQFAELYADEAKRLGQRVELRSDWDKVKVRIMEQVVRAKFAQNLLLARRLAETGNKPLLEGNYWHDLFWGIDLKTREGENHLGRILMDLRKEFQTNGLPDGSAGRPVLNYGPLRGITVTDEDITQINADCIVNAANKTLLGGGGVDGAIHREAGPELLEECRTLGGCEVGEAKLTKGYRLPARYVIHTVGPVYGKDDDIFLNNCYWNCMELAMNTGIHSIAFPAISTGKFCFPKKKATEIAIQTVLYWKDQHPDYPIDVILSCVDQRICQYACDILSGMAKT